MRKSPAFRRRRDLGWFIVSTNDLEFLAILAAGAVDGPSVVQIRTQDLLSDGAVSIVAKHSKRTENIERGTLPSTDEGGMPVRMLPLRRSHGCRGRPPDSPHSVPLATPITS
jgi:hypothetical protein